MMVGVAVSARGVSVTAGGSDVGAGFAKAAHPTVSRKMIDISMLW
jgi:hypothetical protein